MKGREIHEILHGKVEPVLMKVLVQIGEDQQVINEKIVTLAELVDQITNIVAQMTVVTERAKTAVEEMQARDAPETP